MRPTRRPFGERAYALGFQCPEKLGVCVSIGGEKVLPHRRASLLIDHLKRPAFAAFGQSVYLHANRDSVASYAPAQRRILNFRVIILNHDRQRTASHIRMEALVQDPLNRPDQPATHVRGLSILATRNRRLNVAVWPSTKGAVIARCLRPPTKVIVFQCPCGA